MVPFGATSISIIWSETAANWIFFQLRLLHRQNYRPFGCLSATVMARRGGRIHLGGHLIEYDAIVGRCSFYC